MVRVSVASAFIVWAVAAFASTVHAAQSGRLELLSCTGMKLAQNAQPDDGSSGAGQEPPPQGDGSADDNSQPDNDDDGDDNGTNPNQASPPESAQPPGCIYRDGPLELLV
jgi:hypothetical protein